MAALLSAIFGGYETSSQQMPYDETKYSNARLRSTINRFSYSETHTGKSGSITSNQNPVMTQSPLTSDVEAVEQSQNSPQNFVPGPNGTVNLVTNREMPGPVQYITESETNNTLSCPRQLPAENTMGCWMFPNSEVPFERRQVDTLFTPPGTAPQNVYVRDTQYDPWGSSMTAKWSTYVPQNYSSPVLDSDERKSTGVMVNAYTGKMYETFEDDMPPPNTDKEIPRERFEMSNPRLIQMQGNIDVNRYPRSKKEICQTVMRKDDGPNVWGDQLYADRRRALLEEYATRDVWQNRHGEYSIESVDDRRPVGYVGYVNAVRPLPYLPATQRTDTNNHGWTGVAEDQFKKGPSWDKMLPRVTTTRPDLSECSRVQAPDATNEAVSNHVVIVGGINMKGTNRSTTSQFTRQGPIDPGSAGYDRNEMLEPSSLRATLKAAMEQSFSSSNIDGTSQNTGYLPVVDTDLRPTQKGLMAGQFPVTTAGQGAQGTGYVPVIDTDLRATQKGLMAGQFPVTTAGQGAQSTGYVPVIDTDLRATQKGLMAGQFPVTTAGQGAQSTGYVPVIDTDLRATQKGLMAGQFPVTTAGHCAQSTGYVPIIDTDLRATQKGLMAGQFPVTTAGQGAQSTGYVPVIDTNLRATQKGLMSGQFNPANAGSSNAGNVIEFQGALNGTKREYYENVPRTPFIGQDNMGVTQMNQNSSTKLDPCRGTTAMNWFPVSRVPVDGGHDTSTRWVGHHGRTTEREQQHRFPLSDRATVQEPRVLPTYYSKSCKEDTDDESDGNLRWLPPTYYTEASIGGR